MKQNNTNESIDRNNSLKRSMLSLCIENETCSISDFSRNLGISVPTATKFAAELLEAGYIREEGKVSSSGGRKPIVYGLNPNAGYFLGIDVARQHFHICVTDFRGRMIHFIQDIEFVLENNADSFRRMAGKIKEEIGRADIPWQKILGVGISLSGRVNPETGYSLTYFARADVHLSDLFQNEFQVPVFIENDSRAMAYGEYLTLGKEANRNMIFMNVSYGLGMGMILDGKLYYGTSGFSGEIGHFPLLDNNVLCRCGKVGCLETGASGIALTRLITTELKNGRRSSLTNLWKENGELRLHEILKAVEEEDFVAIEGIGQVGEVLGKGIAGIINIFNPGLVVIGGRLVVGKDYLMLPIRTAVNKHSLSLVSSDTKIQFSTLGRKAASYGDCLLSRSKVLGLM